MLTNMLSVQPAVAVSSKAGCPKSPVRRQCVPHNMLIKPLKQTLVHDATEFFSPELLADQMSLQRRHVQKTMSHNTTMRLCTHVPSDA